ncbi:MAG: hypothetical protein B7X04_00305 [Parcubacteria group bacterium 21-54-25]|nr:MAG: hypothetical protein B7X04_00305 [Parcubacteria group bacterium 21-54-25]HQU07500.1 peptidoglycan-binding domain-containing protein [Candidatus Paceibacterota bacterium]
MNSKTFLSVAIGFTMAVAPFAAPLAFADATTTATSTATSTATTTSSTSGTTATSTTATSTQTTTGSTATSTSVTTTSTSPTIASLQAELQSLLVEVQALTAKLVQVRQQVASTTIAIQQQLHVGSTGPNVTLLQQLLAGNPSVYPQGLVTGYYGPLTEAAVKRFQKDHGIESVGDVGPQTRAVLNAYLANATSTSPRALLHEFEAEGSASTTASGSGEPMVTMCHHAGLSGNSQTIVVAQPATFAHIEHGDSIGACSSEGENSQGSQNSDHGNGQGGGESNHTMIPYTGTTTQSTAPSTDNSTQQSSDHQSGSDN